MTTCPLTAEERANQLFFCTVCRGGGDYIKDCSRCNGRGVVPPNKSDLIAGLKAYAAQENKLLLRAIEGMKADAEDSAKFRYEETAALRAERDELKAVVEKLRKHSEELTELAAERIRSLQRIVDEASKHIDKASAAHEAAEADARGEAARGA